MAIDDGLLGGCGNVVGGVGKPAAAEEAVVVEEGG